MNSTATAAPRIPADAAWTTCWQCRTPRTGDDIFCEECALVFDRRSAAIDAEKRAAWAQEMTRIKRETRGMSVWERAAWIWKNTTIRPVWSREQGDFALPSFSEYGKTYLYQDHVCAARGFCVHQALFRLAEQLYAVPASKPVPMTTRRSDYGVVYTNTTRGQIYRTGGK